MANLTTVVRSILAGTKTPVATTTEMKTALTTLYDFLTQLLGTDSTDKATARLNLGAIDRGGVRNVLINGDFRINQRGYAGGATAGANEYTFDRWRLITQGTSLSSAADGAGLTVTIPTGGLEQVVEGALINGGSYNVDWEGTATCTINGAATLKHGSVTLPADTNVSVKFFGGTLTRAMVTPGATGVWECRPLPLELLLALRYFEKPTEYGTFNGAASSNHSLAFLVPKRSPRTVTVTSISGTVTLVGGSTTAEQFTVTAAGTAGNRTFVWVADAEL
jgi:hypothetical protein